jgi:hypothetical protein
MTQIHTTRSGHWQPSKSRSRIGVIEVTDMLGQDGLRPVPDRQSVLLVASRRKDWRATFLFSDHLKSG